MIIMMNNTHMSHRSWSEMDSYIEINKQLNNVDVSLKRYLIRGVFEIHNSD